jgi:phosphatidylethanolamine-binding protein (PEBP) family uncharacterized protein
MKANSRKSPFFTAGFVSLALALGGASCTPAPAADDTPSNTGGKPNTGGSKAGGSGGSSTSGTGGSSNTGGSSSGSSGGAGGSPDTGGSTGSGGSSGSGGSDATGGSAGSTGGANGGSLGGAGGSSSDGGGTAETGSTDSGPLVFKITDFDPPGAKGYMGFTIPKVNSLGGGNHSPAMEWSGAVPAGAKSWAITMIDTTTAPNKTQPVKAGSGTKVHFAFFDIPIATRSLKKDLPHMAMIPDPAGMKASGSFNNTVGWFGPGGGLSIYVITLRALDVDALTEVKAGADQKATAAAIAKHTIGMAEVVAVGNTPGI